MAESRLTSALSSGAMTLPASGRIALFAPAAEQDISALARDRVHVISRFFPDHDAWRRRGYETAVEPQGPYAGAVVFLPRAKALARDLIARAMAATGGGPVIVDGQKTDGVDSLLRACRRAGAGVDAVFAKAHGKTFVLSGGDFSGWAAPGETRIEGGFLTAPGVFSADGVDRGSAALAAVLPPLEGRVCDLGAGWGWLSHRVLQSPRVRECHLVEADHLALDCARRNVDDPRAMFHWADATTFEAAAAFEHLVSNPPFHISRAADAEIGRGFIRAAARLLGRNGTLWLVANRHLPYERDLAAAFHELNELAGNTSFKVYRARKPRAPQH